MQISETPCVCYTVRAQSYNYGPVASSVDVTEIWVGKMLSYNHTGIMTQAHAGVTHDTGC